MKFDLNKISPWLAVLAVLLFAASIPNRWMDHDEAMLGEVSYWWWKIGYYRSILHYGLPNGWHEIQYSTHKAFVLLGAGLVSVFGWSLTVLRIVPLFFTAALILLMRSYLRHRFPKQRSLAGWAIALLFFQSMFLVAGFRYRPETMLMTLGFLHFWMLENYLLERKLKYLILAGLAAGFGIFTHLNGIAYLGAGGLLLWSYRRFGVSFLYGFLALLIGSLYFHNMMGPGEFQAFLIQYRRNPNLSEADWQWYSPIVKLLSEHLRFFHSAREAITTLFFLVALIGSWSTLRSRLTPLLRYLLFTILFLGALTRQTPIYYLLYLPYIVVVVAVHLQRWSAFNPVWKVTTLSLLVTFIVINTTFSIDFIKRRVNTVARTAEMTASLPDGVKVLGPTSLLFNGLDEGYQIRSFKAFKFLVRNDSCYPDTYEGLIQFLNDNDNEFLILDHIWYNQDEFHEYRNPADLAAGEKIGAYEVTEIHGDWTLLKRVQ